MLWLVLLFQAAAADAHIVARCAVTGDAEARVYELRRDAGDRWVLVMHSRRTGPSPVRLPLPGARPEIRDGGLTLEFKTLNGGRDVEWSIGPSSARLDVHANFELEVNIEPDLDPRVELMNTDGPLTRLSCDRALPEPAPTATQLPPARP